jgi:hypothetical protein
MTESTGEEHVDSLFPYFANAEWGKIKGYGHVALVRLDRETSDFAHLIGNEVAIRPTHDGLDRLYRVKGIERFAHCAPWRQGESIGLLVEDVPDV